MSKDEHEPQEEEVEEEVEEVEAEEEEEPEDIKGELDAECGDHHCASLKAELEKCTMRVESRSDTAETCEQEFKDFMHCVDHCTAPQLFAKLR